MRYRLECPANRYVFKSHLNCSESTAGSPRQSGSEFQTVGPATEKHGSQRCRVELVELTVDAVWQIADAGDRELQRLARNNRRGNSELNAENNDGLSQQACTAVVVWRSVSLLVSINEVNLRRARLVLGWVTVSGSVPGHLSWDVISHPGQLSLAILLWVGTMSTSRKFTNLLTYLLLLLYLCLYCLLPPIVLAVRPKRCHTLLNPAHRQDYTVACLTYTLQTMMPLPG